MDVLVLHFTILLFCFKSWTIGFQVRCEPNPHMYKGKLKKTRRLTWAFGAPVQCITIQASLKFLCSLFSPSHSFFSSSSCLAYHALLWILNAPRDNPRVWHSDHLGLRFKYFKYFKHFKYCKYSDHLGLRFNVQSIHRSNQFGIRPNLQIMQFSFTIMKKGGRSKPC